MNTQQYPPSVVNIPPSTRISGHPRISTVHKDLIAGTLTLVSTTDREAITV